MCAGAAARVTCVPRAGVELRGATGLLSTYPRYLIPDTPILSSAALHDSLLAGHPSPPLRRHPQPLLECYYLVNWAYNRTFCTVDYFDKHGIHYIFLELCRNSYLVLLTIHCQLY